MINSATIKRILTRKLVMLNKHIVKAILLLSAFSTSYALIKISPTLMTLNDQNNNRIITVTNPNNYKSYISMEVEAFSCKNKDFSCKPEEHIPYKNIKDKIIFSAPKFILGPKQSKKLYISWHGSFPEQPLQIVYHASDHSENAIVKTSDKTPGNKNISVNLSIRTVELSHIMLFGVGTQESLPIIYSEGDNLTIQNTGSSLLLVKLSQRSCPTDSKKCIKSARVRTVQPHSVQKYKFDSKHDVLIRYFYNNSWQLKNINYTT